MKLARLKTQDHVRLKAVESRRNLPADGRQETPPSLHALAALRCPGNSPLIFRDHDPRRIDKSVGDPNPSLVFATPVMCGVTPCSSLPTAALADRQVSRYASPCFPSRRQGQASSLPFSWASLPLRSCSCFCCAHAGLLFPNFLILPLACSLQGSRLPEHQYSASAIKFPFRLP